MGLRAGRGYFCTADCASPNAHLKCVWGFVSSVLPSCNQGCCFQVVLAAKPCFDLARDHLQTCQECSCSCSLLQSRGSTSTAQLQDCNQQHPLNPSSVPPPLCSAGGFLWVPSCPCPLLPSPTPPRVQLSFLKEMPKLTCQSFPAEPKAGPGVCHPRSRGIGILLSSPAPQLPPVPRAVDPLQGENSAWYLQT